MPRLLAHLRELGLTSGDARRALEAGKVRLDGIPTADGGRDVEPSQVTLAADGPRIRPGRDLFIVYRDEDLAVVWKPPGMLSVPARGRSDGHLSALGLVGRICGTSLAVHRIDEDTSGLLMVARTEAAQLHLKQQLEEHTVERRYVAIVSGHPPVGPVTIDSVLFRDRGDGLRGSRPDGRPDGSERRAVTHIRRLAMLDRRTSLVEATLETGRTHQVRIHLAESGFPILGDPLYATIPVARRASRLALHAAVLGFVHPTTGAALRFTAPLADDLEHLRRGIVHEAEQPREARPAPRGGGRPAAGRPAKGRRK